ncbi:MAG: copper amine oxidase N-terminal domain-containing protein [Armatimonadota bacterium]
MKILWVLAALLSVITTAHAADVYIVGGRCMVPLRQVGETFGASVQYNSRSRGISISLDYQKVDMTVDSRRARVNTHEVDLDTSAVVVGGVCYVPARFVSDTFGFSITWNSGARQLIVLHPKTHKQVVMVVGKHVPPGLAKKGGMPPGQAKKYHDNGNDHGNGGHDDNSQGHGHKNGKGK